MELNVCNRGGLRADIFCWGTRGMFRTRSRPRFGTPAPLDHSRRSLPEKPEFKVIFCGIARVFTPLDFNELWRLTVDYVSWITTISVFIVGIGYTIHHFKIVRTAAFIERMNSPAMISVRSQVDEWLRVSEPNDAKLSQLEDDAELRTAVRIVYATLTELAVAYNYGILNRRMTHQLWDILVPEYWDRLRFYIDHQRLTHPQFGFSFQRLAESMKSIDVNQ